MTEGPDKLSYEVLLVDKGRRVTAHLDELDITVSAKDIPEALEVAYEKALKRLKAYARDDFPIPNKADKQLVNIALPNTRAPARRLSRRGRRHLHVVRDTGVGRW